MNSPLVPSVPASTGLEAGGQPLDAQAKPSTDLLALAWRGRWMILLGVLLGGVTAWVLLQKVTPLYASTSRVYVERQLPKLLGADMQFGQSNSYLFTQAELIRSTGVLAKVVESPECAGLETFRDVDNPVGMLYEALAVSVGRDDEIINVSLELPNKFEAAQLVNGIVDSYISQYAEKRRHDTVEVLNILRAEKQRRDEALTASRKELEAFREANPELAVHIGNQDVASDRFSRLLTELNRTELDQLTAKAELERLKEMAASPTLRPMLMEIAMDSIGKQHSTKETEQLEVLRQEIELRLATELGEWGEEYPTVKSLKMALEQLEERIAEKEEAIAEEKQAALKAYAFNVREQYEFLTSKLSELRKQYQDQFDEAKESSANAIRLATLEETYRRAVDQADIVDQRIKELDLSDDVGALNVSIIESAGVAELPSYPSKARFLGTGAMLGALCGFGLVWLRDLLDHRLRSADEIQDALQLPVLGVLRKQLGRMSRQELGQLVLEQPRSTSAEAFRTLRTAVHFSLAGDDCQVLVVTSPSPGDGKSVVASNLAIATAQADRRVLLIDADMRKATQHTIFGVDRQLGLSSVLAERRPVEQAILPDVAGTLDFLPAGATPSNPAELLNNAYFVELLERLKQDYDRIIIDSPPVMPVADSRVIAAHSDAVLLVLRAEKSTRRLSVAARNELWRVNAQRLGVVVNAVPQSKGGSYGYGYGYGGYGGYGEMAYGHEEESTRKSSDKTRLLKSRPVEPVDPVEPALERR